MHLLYKSFHLTHHIVYNPIKHFKDPCPLITDYEEHTMNLKLSVCCEIGRNNFMEPGIGAFV